ncbi:MAG TPA: bifunctional transaldolase/phosoglucose isomerase, partial [Elusimicrobiales bacterium]|nr:bifunctional transaldolase/phosoglucose isomerase [Elusimicrobiales bacterium]
MDILKRVKDSGQSLWLDSLSREMLLDGSLAAMIKELGITGVTSNPAIFEAAISGSSQYDEEIERLTAEGASPETILETLEISDIRRAADLFSDIHSASAGTDGFVSIEVRPSLAGDAEGTVREGTRLFGGIARRNVMIKVPATPAGVRAGAELLKKGVNVNFTLIFSPDRYEETVKAYIDAVSWRAAGGLPVDSLASVASFFVSRIDTRTDEELEALIQAEEALDVNEAREQAAAAKGRTGIANSLVAYGKYSAVFSSPAFRELAAKGAKKQRILWASTGVKNPAYKDTLYADALMLPGSVNTLPLKALKAFLDHGNPETAPLKERLAAAEVFFPALEKAGVDFRGILDSLEKDGVELFSRAHDSLIRLLEGKKRTLPSGGAGRSFEPPRADAAGPLDRPRAEDFVKRLWNKDAGLWKAEPEHVAIINKSLGWLDSPYKMLERVDEINLFRDEVVKKGFRDAVLLGMGGSSLAPEVLRTVFQRSGFPALHVLDTTDPDWVLAVKKGLNVRKTLFIFASKSGGTIEPSSQFKYFWSLLKKAGVKRPGDNFVAITDPGTGLEALAKSRKFRKTFLNFPDIGGRFSALSYFGLVPAALCGTDIRKLLERAVAAADACKAAEPGANHAVALGAFIGGMALKGRNKLTLLMPRKLEAFGLWIEQLVAESTGKEGKGVLPVCMEPLSGPESYRNDRVFVHARMGGTAADQAAAAGLDALKKAGHPVFTVFLKDEYDLGAEFFRWEAATAAAGAILSINPFDQPNVKEAKDLTLKKLEAMIAGVAPAGEPAFACGHFSAFASESVLRERGAGDGSLEPLLDALKGRDYAAILAYLPDSPDMRRELKKLRERVGAFSGAATTLAYGPRYLHSSGQLHKGGPGDACFVILTNQAANDISIPGEKYTFGQLEMAQAMGDFEALSSRGSRVLRFHLKRPSEKSLKNLNARIAGAARRREDDAGAASAVKEVISLTKKKLEERNMIKSPVRKTTAKTKPGAATNEYVLVDHPRNLENITSRHYTIRVSANDARASVDVSINDGP